jgi:hypothetical protein
MEASKKTHKYQDPICFPLIEFGELVVLFLCNLGVHREEKSGHELSNSPGDGRPDGDDG